MKPPTVCNSQPGSQSGGLAWEPSALLQKTFWKASLILRLQQECVLTEGKFIKNIGTTHCEKKSI